MDFSVCLQQIQKYLENNPVIILGSGSSAAYGLPLMSELFDELKRHESKFDATEFKELCDNLVGTNLEEAIDRTTLSEVSLNTLCGIIWSYINERDLLQFNNLLQDSNGYAIADLLRVVIGTASNTATVITTNYDRLAEYAADIIEATAITGFEGHIIKSLEFPKTSMTRKRIYARERIVNIWKVHGSLDWFESSTDKIVSFPLMQSIPNNHKPLIIAPGKGKYNFTHNEPYRDVIAQADLAFSSAGSFLCVGYGFNDSHIQPKLIEQIKNGKPIVVICKTATEACKHNVISSEVKKYVVIEHSSEGKTSVKGTDYSEVYDGDFWSLPEFIKTIWR